MAVTCATCGEELLGAVNRCWKCGREVLSTPDAATAPPVRRAPLLQSVKADDDGVATTDGWTEEPPPANNTPDGETEMPLAAKQTAVLPLRTARLDNGERGGIAPWLAIASIVLGLSSMVLGAISSWALLLAGGGLVCGTVGLQSPRRITATIGLLLCLMGVTVGGVRLSYDTFIFIRGEPIVPTEPLPEDDLMLDPFDSMEPAEPLE